jgi:hypothetical protein
MGTRSMLSSSVNGDGPSLAAQFDSSREWLSCTYKASKFSNPLLIHRTNKADDNVS